MRASEQGFQLDLPSLINQYIPKPNPTMNGILSRTRDEWEHHSIVSENDRGRLKGDILHVKVSRAALRNLTLSCKAMLYTRDYIVISKRLFLIHPSQSTVDGSPALVSSHPISDLFALSWP